MQTKKSFFSEYDFGPLTSLLQKVNQGRLSMAAQVKNHLSGWKTKELLVSTGFMMAGTYAAANKMKEDFPVEGRLIAMALHFGLMASHIMELVVSLPRGPRGFEASKSLAYMVDPAIQLLTCTVYRELLYEAGLEHVYMAMLAVGLLHIPNIAGQCAYGTSHSLNWIYTFLDAVQLS